MRVSVAPVGRLVGERSQAFRRRLALLSVVDGAEVVVDLAAVPVLDKAAARSLADAASRLRGRCGRLRIERLRGQPREMLLPHAFGLELELDVRRSDAAAAGRLRKPRSRTAARRETLHAAPYAVKAHHVRKSLA